MNQLERCAAMLQQAQRDPKKRAQHFAAAHDLLQRIAHNSARRIANLDLREDAVQDLMVRLWRRVIEKPKLIEPGELRVLIDGTFKNAMRDDTRARRRNGDAFGLTAGHDAVSDDAAAGRRDLGADDDPTLTRVDLVMRMQSFAQAALRRIGRARASLRIRARGRARFIPPADC